MSVAINEPATSSNTSLPPAWHRSAPPRLVEECGDDAKADWKAWRRYLSQRKQPALPPFLKGDAPPLWWATGEDRAALPALDELLANLHRTGKPDALVALAATYALPKLAKKTSAEAWWELAEQLHFLASEAAHSSVDPHGNPQDVLRQQLLAGELPLALSYLFPELAGFHDLRAAARSVLSEALVELTDGQGMPQGRLLPVFGPLWASWTRCRWIGERLKRGCWSPEAEVQFQWLVRNAIRLTDQDGRLMLTESPQPQPVKSQSWPRGLYKSALSLVGDRADCAAANAVLPKRVVPKKLHIGKCDVPAPSLESEWSGVAVLATDWKRSAVRLALSYAGDPMQIELADGREHLLAGLWLSQTTCNGEAVRVRGEWEQACFQADKSRDYLELCVELSHGLRLERQILLSRDDRILYLADVVIAADGSPRQLTHTTQLPIGPDAKWTPEEETRDGSLLAKKGCAAVLPLALAEWRSDPRGGRLDVVDGKVTLSQSGSGRALYVPLLIDLDHRRWKEECTWRQLTVAESLEKVRPDVAVGFRAQCGDDQWLFYRSLAPAANRTLLGQNIAGEFFAGRFHSTGKTDEWIEIEAC